DLNVGTEDLDGGGRQLLSDEHDRTRHGYSSGTDGGRRSRPRVRRGSVHSVVPCPLCGNAGHDPRLVLHPASRSPARSWCASCGASSSVTSWSWTTQVSSPRWSVRETVSSPSIPGPTAATASSAPGTSARAT